jgi:predicted HD phosphohydrolase
MSRGQAGRFAATPFARQAVRGRRWDDSAKQPGVAHEGLEHFPPLPRQLAGDARQG